MQKNYQQRIVDFFNNRTAYDSEDRGHPENAQRLLDFVTLRSSQTILDVCTGTGLVAIPLARIVGEQGLVIGVDIKKLWMINTEECQLMADILVEIFSV